MVGAEVDGSAGSLSVGERHILASSFAMRTSLRRHHHARLHVESVAECRYRVERVYDSEVEIP